MLETTEKIVRKETKRGEMTKPLLNRIHKSEDTHPRTQGIGGWTHDCGSESGDDESGDQYITWLYDYFACDVI